VESERPTFGDTLLKEEEERVCKTFYSGLQIFPSLGETVMGIPIPKKDDDPHDVRIQKLSEKREALLRETACVTRVLAGTPRSSHQGGTVHFPQSTAAYDASAQAYLFSRSAKGSRPSSRGHPSSLSPRRAQQAWAEPGTPRRGPAGPFQWVPGGLGARALQSR